MTLAIHINASTRKLIITIISNWLISIVLNKFGKLITNANNSDNESKLCTKYHKNKNTFDRFPLIQSTVKKPRSNARKNVKVNI